MKTSAISIRVSDEVKEAIDKAAAADQRSTTSLITKLMVDFLRKRGMLK